MILHIIALGYTRKAVDSFMRLSRAFASLASWTRVYNEIITQLIERGILLDTKKTVRCSLIKMEKS